MQLDLFPEQPKQDKNIKKIGPKLTLVFNKGDKNLVILKNDNVIIKQLDLSEKLEKKLLVIDAVNLGATKLLLARALKISRQTIHNYIEGYKQFGTEGLLAGYHPKMGKNLAECRRASQSKRMSGNKAVILSEMRKSVRIEKQNKQMELDFEWGEKTVPKDEQLFNSLHDWKFTRFAGIFLYLIVLISNNQWLKLVMGYFGSSYKTFLVFLLMAARNTGSIEQLKNIHLKEAALILGLNKLPSIKNTWQWFYAACNMRRSIFLCKSIFKQQVRGGLVSAWIWFTDGHHLPYSGKKKVHPAYNTQRKMMMPGQTNMVTCDLSGRIVDFQIQEGKGDLKNHIIKLKKNWKQELTDIPCMVFDREGYDAKFFNELIENKIPFVTWEKNVDLKMLVELKDNCFTESFEMNNKQYRCFAGEKKFIIKPDTRFILRRIFLWNQASGKRTCGLAWDAGRNMSTIECAQAILSRWGASENTFKHLYDKHPFHYHPGFKTKDSQNQLRPHV